jgi:hypothetical protein
MVKVRYGEGSAGHTGPESCVVVRKENAEGHTGAVDKQGADP